MVEKKKKRLLLRGDKKCPFNCRYCFADLECFQSSDLISKSKLSNSTIEADILYPSCDTEIDFTDSKIEEIVRLAESTKAIAVSISTKRKMSDLMIHKLSTLNKQLVDIGVMLKFSISISTKNQLNVIEEGTSSYTERLELVEKLNIIGVVTSINIKPILPFIEVSEYYAIVDDFVDITPYFMLGGLYVDTNDKFGKSIIENYPNLISKHVVDWIPDKPVWDMCYDPLKVKNISDYIFSKGGNAYQSDQEFVTKLIELNKETI